MAKLSRIQKKKYLLWLVLLCALFVTAVSVYAVLPSISLDSPTSFPVDI